MAVRKLSVWMVSIVGMIVMISSCQNHSVGESRSPGERDFRAKCAICHRLPKPSDQTDEEWPTFLTEHAERAGLTDEQVKLIAGHLSNSD